MNTYRAVTERIHDFKAVEEHPEASWLNSELAHCQDCGIPFCHACGCPLSNPIPEINAAALAGRWSTALSRLLSTSPFPEFTSRVCPALCEGSCVQGLHQNAVPCRLVELAVIERGFADKLVQARPPQRRLPLQVAIIGSGPAGLAAAWRLNRAGLRATVYEKDAKPGGFLRYGIPDFKLEKELLDRRIAILEEEGILFECGVEAGPDISGSFLHKRYDALLLACGARQKRDLGIEGRGLDGICFATDYLSAQNRALAGEAPLPAQFNACGKRVIIIGGGDTGSDCMGTAWRQGAASVRQLEILPEPPRVRAGENPWPEWPRILRTSSSHEEGGERRWGVTATAFLPAQQDAGKLGAVRCTRVNWVAQDGRLSPLPVENSEFTLPADLLLLAMGFGGVEAGALLPGLGLALEASGRLPCDESGRLPVKGMYACGDAALGPSLVVRAMASGLRTAQSVLQDLVPGSD